MPSQSPGQPPHGDAGGSREPGPRRLRGPVLLSMLAAAVAVVLVLVLTGNGSRHQDGSPAGGGGGPVGADDFHAGDTALVVLDGVSGRIQLTADPHAHAVTGSFHRTDGTADRLRGRTVHDASAGRDALEVGCEDQAGVRVPCAGDLVLTVPAHTGLRLRQTSGQAVLSGLGGDVTVDASSIQLTTAGLRSRMAHFTVTSGSADLSFAGVPDDFDLHETSASVTAHLPHSPDGYAVATAASSASTQVTVPRNSASAHRLSLAVTSGSLSVASAG